MFFMQKKKGDDLKRVQVPAPKAVRDELYDLSAQVSKERDEDIGIGGIAAELLAKLFKRPDLVAEFLHTDSAAAEEEIAPKKASRKR